MEDFATYAETLINSMGYFGVIVVFCVALFALLYREMQDRKQRDETFTKTLEQNTSAIKSIETLIKVLHGVEDK